MESTFISELVSIYQDNLDVYSSATKVNGETEDVQPSDDDMHSSQQFQEPPVALKLLFHSLHSTKKPLHHKNGN